MRWFSALLLVGLLAAPAVGAVAINEIRIDQPGTDNDEYVELFLSGGGPLTGITYLVIGDGPTIDSSGVIEAVVDLDLQVIPGDGFFLIAEATFTLGGATPDLVTGLNFENSDNVTHMLVTGFSGLDGDDLDTDDDGAFDVTPWTGIVDTIALIEEANPPTGTEYSYGPTLGPDVTFVPGHAYRATTDGTGTWTIGQFETAGGADTPGASNSVFPPPDAVGRVTATGLNTTTGDISDLCATGQNTPLTRVITSLPADGILSSNGVPIVSVPRDITGTLTYTPNTNSTGLDTFDFNVRDSVGQTDATDATQEVAVQSGTVLISEIMHRPAGSDDVFEFVEIYNYGDDPVLLTRLDVRTAADGLEKDTTDNLLGESIPAGAVRILAPEDPTNPSGAVDFRCEWELEEDGTPPDVIIRVPLTAWEALFQASDTDCFASEASRVLLFGTNGAVLDLVDLNIQTDDCITSQAGSYSLDPSLGLNIENFNATFLNSNDNPLRWGCAATFGTTRTGTTFSDKSTVTSVVFHKTAFDTAVPCPKGACCLLDGGCVEDLFEEDCDDLNCNEAGVFWHSGETCAEQTCSVVQTPAKCCLPGPAGLCANLTDCECTRVEGNADTGTCESNPGCTPSDGVTFNELDYDQDGTDTLELLELFGTANFDLTGWTVEFHNGNASTNGPTVIASRTLFLEAEPGGGSIPNDGGGVGYLVIADFGVANLDIDLCDPDGAECSNRIENGGSGANGSGDGIVLLNNDVVVEALSYDTGTTGFVARGGGADGLLLPDIGVVDAVFGGLQRLPDGQTWTLTPNTTPGATNVIGGACCSGVENATCTVVAGADACTSGLSGEYNGDLTFCDPINPCIPRGACCLPNGVCLSDVTSNSCELQGGAWNGEGSECADVTGFVGCVSGPGVAFDPGCDPSDLDIIGGPDGDVDLRDFYVFQRTGAGGVFCAPDPTGACCRVDGVCVVTNQFACEAFAGDYQGDGVTCPPDPACEAVGGDILINELLANDNSTDTNEFIELFGTSGASLTGLSLIVVDGDTGGDPESPNLQRVNLWLDLVGLSLNGSGYLVIGTGPSTLFDVGLESIAVLGSNSNGIPDELQNGTQTYALVATADVVLDGVQLTDDSVAAINANAIDTVATTDGTAGDPNYFGAPVVTSLDGSAMGYGHRIPNGTDTNTAADWEVLDAVEFGEVNLPTVPTWDAANTGILGFCCDGTFCTQKTFADCGTSAFGFNTACTPDNPCVGSCCDTGLVCTETTEAGCVGSNSFLGSGTNCTDNVCIACTSIVTAEANADGTTVCVTDVIMTNMFDMIHSTSRANFIVQDEIGTNGIVVQGFPETLIAALLVGVTRGDLVEIRGDLGTFFTDRQLEEGAIVLSLSVVGTGTLTPFDRTIGSIQAEFEGSPPDPSENDDIMHTLVRLKNVEFAAGDQGDAFLSNFNYTIHDATTPANTMTCRINNGNNPPPITGTTIPTGAVDLVGIMSSFGGAYQIAIFEDTDIE